MAQRGKRKPAAARARKAVSRVAKKVMSRVRSAKPKAARPPRRPADIPIDVRTRTYTPTQTSLKAPFRITGEDRQRDQEYVSGYAEERFSEEDRLTNKSGDPRIGT